jgi:hypothetical protein
MHHLNNSLRFSASDLVGHLDCHHLTVLDAAVARGSITKPKIRALVLQALVEWGGVAHERGISRRSKRPASPSSKSPAAGSTLLRSTRRWR